MFALRQAVLTFNRENGDNKQVEFGMYNCARLSQNINHKLIYRCSDNTGRCAIIAKYNSRQLSTLNKKI